MQTMLLDLYLDIVPKLSQVDNVEMFNCFTKKLMDLYALFTKVVTLILIVEDNTINIVFTVFQN